jgi:hypothetical protein
MAHPVDLDGQLRLSAIKVEDVAPHWMLPPELESCERLTS